MEYYTELVAFMRDTAAHAALTGPTPNELVFFIDRTRHAAYDGKLILRRYDNVHLTTLVTSHERVKVWHDDTTDHRDVELMAEKLGITVPVIFHDDTVYPAQEDVDRETQKMRDEMKDELPF